MKIPHSILLFLACFATNAPVRAQQELHIEAVDAAIRQEFERQSLPGAVIGVVLGDELVYQIALGHRDLETGVEMTTDTLFQIGSVTKSMTAVLMGILREEGELDYADTLARHLPAQVEIPADLKPLTLAQLASHTAGLPRNAVNRRNVPDSPSVAEPYSIRQLYEGLATTELILPPGQAGRYSNLGYALLGHVVERASGESYEELLIDRICRPLGMTSTFIQPTKEQELRIATHYWVRDDPRVGRERWKFGEVAGHGGVVSNVEDLAKYLALQWTDDEAAPVRHTTLAELHRPVTETEDGDTLGMGWFMYEIPGGPIVGHDGEVDGHSASIAFLPQRKLGVIALVNLGRDAAPSLAKTTMRAVVTGR